MIKYILIDLDGTITNPKEGITKSIQYALRKIGIEVEDLESLCKHIGPPLREGFQEFWNMNEEEALQAIMNYREYYGVTGIFLNEEYLGMKELLESLMQAGNRLILATSKPEFYAKQILEHFDLSKYFYDICGSTMDGSREKKGDVIRYALGKNKVVDLEEVVMIGDRFHDIVGAKENGIASIGVLYGFGSRDELEQAGADQIAETVKELGDVLL